MKLTPYIPGEQPQDKQYIKLNTNENPYPPSPSALKAIDSVKEKLRLYPDMNATCLRNAIARVNNVDKENVFCGNGSDEVLAFAFAAFFSEKKLIAPDITYSFYPTYAKLFSVDYQTIPVKEDFSIDFQAMMKGQNIILANPNAPTGHELSFDAVEQLARHTKSHGNVLLIDEAYVAFAKQSAVSLLNLYDNILIVRTLSKSHGLAGLRVGYALGSTKLIDGLRRVKDSFNSYPLDAIAQAVACAAIEDITYTTNVTQKVIEAREYTKKSLEEEGIYAVPSSTNFLFVKADQENAAWVKEALMQNGILVRHFDRPRIAPYLRISIGTLPEMKETVKLLTLVLKERG